MEKKSILYVVIAGCMWGCMGLLVRSLNKLGLASMEIVFLRSVVTLIAMAILLLFVGKEQFYIKGKDLWCFIGTGALSVTFFNFCYFKTITYTSLSVAAILLYTSPVFIMLMSAPLFSEKITKSKVVAVLLAILGCGFVSGIAKGEVVLTFAGILCGLGAGFGYALYSIFGRYALLKGYSSMTITFYTFLFSTITTFFMSDAVGAIQTVTSVSSILIESIFLILWVTLLPYLLYTKGLAGLDNGTASVVAAIEPVVATIIGVIIYKEEIDLFMVIGMCLVLASIYIINKRKKV